jgi:hypothetical protein
MKAPLNNDEPLTWEAALLASLDNMTDGSVAWVLQNKPESKLVAKHTVTGFVRLHGQFFHPVPLPKRRGFRLMPEKECFFNCMDMSLKHGLIYVEGYASESSVGIPVHHAWCTDQSGVVIDFTWKKLGKAYFGVAFNESYLRTERLRQLADGDDVCLIRFEGRMYPTGAAKKWKHPDVFVSTGSSTPIKKNPRRPSRNG